LNKPKYWHVTPAKECVMAMIKAQRNEGVLTDLDGGEVTFETNNLANEVEVSDTDKLVHRSSKHVLGDDDCEAK
jgi:hypothetical protein